MSDMTPEREILALEAAVRPSYDADSLDPEDRVKKLYELRGLLRDSLHEIERLRKCGFCGKPMYPKCIGFCERDD